MRVIFEVVGIVIFVVVFAFLLASLIFVIPYYNFDAYEEVYLDGKLVYSGMGRNVGWAQLGEVGNCYKVEEYKVGFWNRFFGKVLNCYVGKDLKVNIISENKY